MHTIHRTIEQVFRAEGGRIRASLIGAVRDFDLAEECVQDAFIKALETWPDRGMPDNPGAWITRVARNRAVDRVRRRGRFEARRDALAALAALDAVVGAPEELTVLRDDLLRLMFTCCHPALNRQAQVGLTLHTLCGLTTDEIARAFLVPKTTLQQRLVRAKRKIGKAGIPYRVPPDDLLPERVGSVRTTVYLIFNEGYAATSGDAPIRAELCDEGIRLGRLLTELPGADAETEGLLALMLLIDARRDARVDAEGEPVLLRDQDRSRWRQDALDEGRARVEAALRRGAVGPYQLQAAIQAVHADAASTETTDWTQIAGLYDVLARVQPSPVVRLNQAVAVAMARGPAEGLARIDALLAEGALARYHLAHSARADLLRRLARVDEAVVAYGKALQLASHDADRRFLAARLAELGAGHEA